MKSMIPKRDTVIITITTPRAASFEGAVDGRSFLAFQQNMTGNTNPTYLVKASMKTYNRVDRTPSDGNSITDVFDEYCGNVTSGDQCQGYKAIVLEIHTMLLKEDFFH